MPIELLNIDCMEYMKDLPDKSFDLAIVDPPYGLNAPNQNMGSHLTRFNYKKEVSTAKKMKHKKIGEGAGAGKLKNRAINMMNCEWDTCPPDDLYFNELFRVSKNQIIWGGNYFNLPPTRGIICWDKIQPWKNFSGWEYAWSSFDRPADIIHYSNTGGNHSEIKIHPTQKPVYLYKWLIENYGKESKTILETGRNYDYLIIKLLMMRFFNHQ